MYEAYTAGEKDYSALISKMKAAGVDAFYVGGYHWPAFNLADVGIVLGVALLLVTWWSGETQRDDGTAPKV